MREILKESENTVTLFNGHKTFTKKEIENYLKERFVLKRQLEFIQTTFKNGGGSQ